MQVSYLKLVYGRHWGPNETFGALRTLKTSLYYFPDAHVLEHTVVLKRQKYSRIFLITQPL